MCSGLCSSRINDLCVLAVWHSYRLGIGMAMCQRPRGNEMDTALSILMVLAAVVCAFAAIISGPVFPVLSALFAVAAGVSWLTAVIATI